MATSLLLCDQCRAAGLRSSIHWVDLPSTGMVVDSYWDEDGDYHYHDPNDRGQLFHCSNDHEFHIRTPRLACGCVDIAAANTRAARVQEPR